ncbi:DNA/RNA helicase [Bacillus sp. T33-2]|nr:DNA/RNA helicase [Bacillus sp. T33-2]
MPESPRINQSFHYNTQLQQFLSGKQLLLDELPFPLEEIHEHYENGYINYRKGIRQIGNGFLCNRCGNDDDRWFGSFPCSRCGEKCTYCWKCLMMGRVSGCTPLIIWTGPEPEYQLPAEPLCWSGTLSNGQQAASNRTVDTIETSGELLVWAVCGAGKTEVLFAGINHALSERKRVCIATPRTDVVLELTPRLKAVFPEVKVASLHGGSEDRYDSAPLTISTTHQLFRFYRAFDVIIVDEVDAFPYSIDETLQFAVRQARKPDSSLIFLTATPSQKWQKECRAGKRNYITIPARFHRHSLPVPEFIWCGNWQKCLKKGKLPENVIRWVKQRLDDGKQALVFVPQIVLMDKMLPFFRKLEPTIESVHAEDPARREKIMKMRGKQILIMLTTTILERGVTFPNVDVAVIGSEDRIFTESALVQIAGRVGRRADYPSGNVTFFHYGKTEAMLKARKQIQSMNNEARQKGLIDG